MVQVPCPYLVPEVIQILIIRQLNVKEAYNNYRKLERGFPVALYRRHAYNNIITYMYIYICVHNKLYYNYIIHKSGFNENHGNSLHH